MTKAEAFYHYWIIFYYGLEECQRAYCDKFEHVTHTPVDNTFSPEEVEFLLSLW